MKQLIGSIALVAFLYGVFEAISGNALVAIFAWLVFGSVCIAGMTMLRQPTVDSTVYRRSDARNRSRTHYTQAQFLELCGLYGNRCAACRRKRTLTADHVVPLYHGGSDDISNIQPLCKPCNSRKGATTIDYRTAR